MSRSKKIQEDLGNTKTRSQDSPAKRWFWTLAREYKGLILSPQEVIEKLDPICQDYVFSGESGERTGYRHYQGHLNLKNKMRFDPLKQSLYPWIHIEKTIDEEGAQVYCTKGETHEDGPWGKGKYFKPVRVDLITNYYRWQEACIWRWKRPAMHRTIEWLWSGRGGIGKSTFARDCFRKLPNCRTTTCRKPDDIILMADESIRIYIIDIPKDSKCRPYIALEQLKNGFVTEAKLKGQQRVVDMYEIPHVIVFCNEEPDMSRMSSDRWDVREITDE